MVRPWKLSSKEMIPPFRLPAARPYNLISLTTDSVASVPADSRKAFSNCFGVNSISFFRYLALISVAKV